jgi:hypothetical protein
VTADDCNFNFTPIIDQLKMLSFEDLFSEDIMKDFFHSNFKLIHRICLSLNSIRFEKKLNSQEKDAIVLCHLHPTFSFFYQPITKGDGNCLWHMISLSLFGNESFTNTLRWLTVISLLLFKNDFTRLLEKRYENIMTDFKQYSSVKYQKILRTALENYEYGDEYHILALATILGGDIYIYNYFTKLITASPRISVEELQKIFNTKCVIKAGIHLHYKPLKNEPLFTKDFINLIWIF